MTFKTVAIGCSLFPGVFCSKTIILDSEEHPLASFRAVPKDVLRWIRLKRLVADLSLDKDILKEALKGNS